jgi:hypothetical protein
VNGFLNQDCVLAQDFESIFPGVPFKIVFQQYRPSATLAVHCGNGFEAGFGPYQSTRLNRYDALS